MMPNIIFRSWSLPPSYHTSAEITDATWKTWTDPKLQNPQNVSPQICSNNKCFPHDKYMSGVISLEAKLSSLLLHQPHYHQSTLCQALALESSKVKPILAMPRFRKRLLLKPLPQWQLSAFNLAHKRHLAAWAPKGRKGRSHCWGPAAARKS